MSELMMQGVNLALVGMGVVFVFLAVLVGLTTLMSSLVARYPAPEPTPDAAGGQRRPIPKTSPGAASDNQRLVAIISAAIHQHRNRR